MLCFLINKYWESTVGFFLMKCINLTHPKLRESTRTNKQSVMIPIIIIIMSCSQHGYPWPSLATSPYHSSPPAGLLGYIPCPHIAAVCKFGLVVLLLLGHMWGSIGVHHLRARPCFSSSVRRVWIFFIFNSLTVYSSLLPTYNTIAMERYIIFQVILEYFPWHIGKRVEL